MEHSVNWVGSYDSMQGYGYFSRKMMEAVSRLLPVTPLAFEQFLDWPTEYFSMAGIDINKPLVYVSVPASPDDKSDIAPVSKYPGRIILFSMYEATNLPTHWPEAIDTYFERVIVPSPFCFDVFMNSMRSENVFLPVHVVPGGIDPATFYPILSWPDRPFTFMCLADRGSRKGYDLVMRAFYDEFGDSNDVRLIIKCRAKHKDMKHVKEFASDYRISLWRADIEDTREIYTACDCYVFPSRGEGYGLPPREAAACAIPVICSKNSGMVDEIEKWAYPLNCKPVKAPDHAIKGNGFWFEADESELRHQMRYVYENRTEARNFALQASVWLRENRTWAQAAKQFVELYTGTRQIAPAL